MTRWIPLFSLLLATAATASPDDISFKGRKAGIVVHYNADFTAFGFSFQDDRLERTRLTDPKCALGAAVIAETLKPANAAALTPVRGDLTDEEWAEFRASLAEQGKADSYLYLLTPARFLPVFERYLKLTLGEACLIPGSFAEARRLL